jgi:hypothetical protein
VIADGDQLRCRWTAQRTYGLVESYSRFPHLQFLKCETDQQLASWVRAWGPIHLTERELGRDGGVVLSPISRYRILQRWLKASANLINAFRNSRCEAYWLKEFLSAEFDLWGELPGARDVEPFDKMSVMEWAFKNKFGISEDTTNWLQRAGSRSISDATAYVLDLTPFASGTGLTCTTKDGKPHIEAGWKLASLQEALRWMVWYDEFRQRSLIFCEECSEPFRTTSAHPRKYCGAKCGHRVAARNWQKRHRK